ncbi:EpsG family protein [Hippea alviniae]|uniref:EpsG family protein n=1 Tax=Hippea alviniae TaxID=1279027 RepID=UPI0003B4B0D5|nr:EpsG family protein [Hippea alviniae]
MLFYVLIYITIIVSAFLSLEFNVSLNKKIKYGIFLLFLVLFVGFRWKIGGDWDSYLGAYKNLSFRQIFTFDPGYVVVEYISKFLGLGIVGVNSICVFLFGLGFIYFLESFELSLSQSLVIAFPYLITVVVGGYSRQSVSIGFVMAMFGAFRKKDIIKTLLFYALAIVFHESAIVSGIIFLSDKRYFSKYVKLTLILLLFISIIMHKVIYDRFMHFYQLYVVSNIMHSTGAIIRSIINTIPGVFLFFLKNEWENRYGDFWMWGVVSIFSGLVLIMVLTTHLTTLGDRILLFFYSLQIIVFNRVIYFVENKLLKYGLFSFISIFYLAMLIGWFLFSSHGSFWVPYKNILL